MLLPPPVAPVTRPVRKTRPSSGRGSITSDYSALLRDVRAAGLLERRRGFYLGAFLLVTGALALTATAFVLLGDSWYQLIVAAALGIVLTQYAFLAHEASHRQIFTSGRANDVAGRALANLVVGISYSWWMTKHSRHHANPNVLGRDPDIARDVVSFTEADAARSTGAYAWFTRRQGYLFFPILTLEGLNLHLHGLRTVFGRDRVDKRPVEIAMLVPRLGLYLAVIFVMLPPGLAAAFIGVQLAVFGVYMGASFAPNHKGMPMLAHDSKVDFLRRQVLTSRSISGGLGVQVFMGGLNHQVEHHLFPNMPRPNLLPARVLVKAYCAAHGIAYTETSLGSSYAIVVRYLNSVGLTAGGDPFDCPAASSFGR
ncbi:fatty acid desaturase family protein [Herbiconiux sp. YIM B11900]|uniref:fatty acid desaturase family protein n=1 Tax=Herbiconiux sp. YIM B11900 TaxID=3404131 RepID=UPI003F873502